MKRHNYIHMWFKSWGFRSNEKLFKEKRNGWYIKEEKRLPGIKHRRDRKEASCSCVWNQLFPQIPSMEVHVSVHRTGPSSSGLPCPIEFKLRFFQIASHSACLHAASSLLGQWGLPGAARPAWGCAPWHGRHLPTAPCHQQVPELLSNSWFGTPRPSQSNTYEPQTPIEANPSSWLSDTCISCWPSKFSPPEDKQGLCSWNI